MQQQTKYAIGKAFLDLSKKKSMDKITIGDIVEICQISRQTFYYHFSDLTAVIEWLLSQKIDIVLKNSIKKDSFQDALELFIDTSVESRSIIRKLLESQRRRETEQMVVKAISRYLEQLSEKKEGAET